MKVIKKFLKQWNSFYKDRQHQQLLLLGVSLFIVTSIFLLNTKIGNFGIGDQHALAKIVCDGDYYQCGTTNTGCPKSYDSSYYVHITEYNTGITSCGIQCTASHTVNQCGWTDCAAHSGTCRDITVVGSDCSTAHLTYKDNDCGHPFLVCCGGPAPYCGDGACNNGETSSSCSGDCGSSSSCNPQDYNECEAGNSDACTDKYGPSIKNHLTHVTHDCSGWHCTDLGQPAGQCGNPAAPDTSTPTPSPTSGPTATPTSAGSSKAKVILVFPAIGGKNGGNTVPHHSTRTITLYFYKTDDDPTDPSIEPAAVKTGQVSLDTSVGSLTYGSFVNNPATGIDLTNLTGTYKVLVKTGSYLRKQFIPKSGDSSATFTFTGGQTTSLPQMTLIAGDIYPPASTTGHDPGDNTLDISDYNLLVRQCYNNKSGCPSQTAADLNDDGNVNGIDYNIILRSFKVLSDQGSQGGDGE